MRVISRKRLKEYCETETGAAARKELDLWYAVVKSADWTNYSDVKRTFGARFDQVGDCGVFDIRNNAFRLITRLRFKSHKVFILQILTHREYDLDDWKAECGCYAKPPAKLARRGTRKGRKRR